MLNILCILLCTLSINLLPMVPLAQAERVDTQKINKSFGDWKVMCEKDVMMDLSKCNILANLSNNKGFVKVMPEQEERLKIMIPSAGLKTIVKLRVDGKQLFNSRLVEKTDFGAIYFTVEEQQTLYAQLKYGNFFYIRFYEPDPVEKGIYVELTERISLKGFQEMLAFYKQETGSEIK